MHRLSLLAPLFILTLAAGCRGDRAADDARAATDSVAEEEYVPPVLTPAESAAAVAEIQRQGEETTRRVMGPDYKPPTDTFVDTPQKQLESCLAQARSVEEPVRSTILRSCERFRNPPQP